ncbi:hypothetical protein [Aliiroseovarius sp.]|uniref:hypothetical protein n=1 Tax=Aliiroseovarius sp. TaxID=1872442 RepID=UPI0026133189|nr:hypothetical protein [Aliiroseovarius sp.]
MGLLRLLIFGFIGLSVVYVAISVYSRSVRREKLEGEWAENHPGDSDSAARADFIEAGMTEYNAGIRPKLILLVYVVPAVLVIATLIMTN